MLSNMFIELSKQYEGEDNNADYIKYFNEGEVDIVIARIYHLNYKLFNQTASQYYGLNYDDIQNIILTEIWRCLDNYDDSKSKGKITTMMCKYIRNACRTYTEKQNTDKRKVNQGNVTDVFSAFEKTDFLEKEHIDTDFNRFETEQYLKQLNLTENQYKFCIAAINGGDDIGITEIAREIGISPAGALNVKKQLQKIIKHI